MPTLLQINVCVNWGSTGKISEQIMDVAAHRGWDTYIAYGRDINPSKHKTIKVGNIFDVYKHYLKNRLFDSEGLESEKATRKFLKEIDIINPDIIHLHNIHDHWLNYEILFTYLSEKRIPVVWTLHDCWAFTGGCFYYSFNNCEQWQTGCVNCNINRGNLFNKAKYQFNLRKKLFSRIDNLTLVPVSKWLENEVRKSFLKNKNIYTITNTIDVNIFKPSPSSEIRNKYNIKSQKYLLAVASSWTQRKGLNDYVELSKHISNDLQLVLVGLTDRQKKALPHNILAIPRTQNLVELAQLYTEASIVLNLSYEETFGMTTIEGYACGTPAIVYNCTASPELIIPETGIIVKSGDIAGVCLAIDEILSKDKQVYSNSCRNLVLSKYNSNFGFNEYINLYESILNKHI